MISKWTNLIVILSLLCSILLTSDVFVEEAIYPKWMVVLILAAVSTILSCINQKVRYRIDALYILVFAFILYLVIHAICSSPSCERLFLFQLAGFFLLYSCFHFNKGKIKADCFYDTLCVAGGIQAIIAICQLYRQELPLGFSDNSTGLAISLVSVCPFVYSHGRTIQINWKKSVYAICLGVISLAIILSGCRACIVALVVMVSFKVLHKRYMVILIGISAVLLLTTHYKKDSSRGRAFIYQTSTNMLEPNTMFFGKGHGGFKKDYMNFQAKVFECDSKNPNAILADNVSHPLNEYLLLLIDYGIIGGIGLLIIVLIFLRCVDYSTPHFLFIMVLGVIACFSYPFRYPLTIILLAYSLAVVECKNVCTFKITKKIKSMMMLGAFLGIVYMLIGMRNNCIWKKQITLCTLGKTEKTLPVYDELYDSMNDNPYFLYNYSMVLFQSGNYQKSNDILADCSRFLNDYDTELLHADIHLALKQYDTAEGYYMHASQMCPNRFQPFYQLMCLYKEVGNIEQARLMAEVIVQKEIKIPSEQVNKIIREAEILLDN